MKKKVITLFFCTLMIGSIFTGCQSVNSEKNNEENNTQTKQENQQIEWKEDSNVIELSDDAELIDYRSIVLPITEKTQKIEKEMILNCDATALNGHFFVDTVDEKTDGITIEAHAVFKYNNEPVWDLPEDMNPEVFQKIELNVTDQTENFKKGDIFFDSKTNDLYLIDEVTICENKMTITPGKLSFEEKMSLISSLNMSGSVSGIEEGSIFPSENVTIEYN